MLQRDGALEKLLTEAVNCSFDIHQRPGPGLWQSVHDTILADKRTRIGHKVDGIETDNAFRADLVVNDTLLIALKSVEKHLPVHPKQALTYIRLLNMKLRLLINFGANSLREDVKRVTNTYQGFVP